MQEDTLKQGMTAGKKIILLLKKEFADMQNLDAIMFSLEMAVASILYGFLPKDLTDEKLDEAADFFTEHVKNLLKLSKLVDKETS